MIKIKCLLAFFIGCIISVAIGLGCWYILDSTWVSLHPYFIVVIVNIIGYTGHGLTCMVVRNFTINGHVKGGAR